MFRKLQFLCLLVVLFSGAASAQDYPSRPVKIVVPYTAGGVPDVIARIVGQRLSEMLSQPFVVVNTPGASGITAVMSVVKAPPDGYTLLLSDPAQTATNQYLFDNLPYDTLRDLMPVSILAYSSPFVVVNPAAGLSSFSEFVAYAKKNPGKLSYGSAGVGSTLHIAMESLNASLGLDLVHIPYKGSGQAVPAFLAGDVPLLITALTAIGPHVKSGKAKLLAVTSANRSPLAPDVPAVSEFIPGFEFNVELGLLAPAGTPSAVISIISTQVAKALKHPEVVARLKQLNLDPGGSTPEFFSAAIRRNQERFGTVVKRSGIKAN
jgi:tripartite-type tricarboxylate transporter receptor subunit TctC